jgi:hypothetical protein
MRKTLQALLLVFASIGAMTAYADPPGRIGRLNYVSGAVSFAAVDAPDWTEAVLNRPLTEGDRLWADRDARAELHVGSTALRLAPMTALDIARLDDSSIALRLEQGTLTLRVRELEADDRVEVLTPAGVVVVRQPGSYRISADPQSAIARMAVNAGELEVATSAQRFLVPAGQVAVVPSSGYPAFELAQASMDEFDRWSMERERRNDTAASTRYVSSYMTGYEDLDHYGSWRTLPEYGAVWIPARVAPGWAPYRYGRWMWVSPWGWTWVDDAPWGFAPFHYGRWVSVDNYWAWAPGRIVRRPVYAPALVAFIGGSHWSRGGPAVGWFPLGWREPFHPWYRASQAHIRNVNLAHAANAAAINVTHVHRNRVDAVTVVPRESFVSARRVARSRLDVPHTELARAEVLRGRAPIDRPASVATSPAAAVQPQRGDDGHRAFGPGARRERGLAAQQPPGTPPAMQPQRTDEGHRGFGPGTRRERELSLPRNRGLSQQPPASQANSAAAPAAPITSIAAPRSPVQPSANIEGYRGHGPGARREREREFAARQQPGPTPPPVPAAQPQRSDDGYRGHGPGARRERELTRAQRSRD